MKIPKDLILSISGARGLCPSVLDQNITYALARAFAEILPPGPVVVSRDSRATGGLLKEAIFNALADSGREILDADLVPLPTTQLAVESNHAAGGIDITASHNPAEYNGLKFLNSEGIFISQQDLDAIKAKLEDIVPRPVSEYVVVTAKDINAESRQAHIDLIIKNAVPGRRLRVAVDAVNGAGSIIIPDLLRKLDCEVIDIATDPTAPFPHTPEPTPANLVWTKEKLEGLSYDLCVVVDPDADRLVLIDEQGNLLQEEVTLPIVAQEILNQGRRGPIVVNMSTSRMIEDVGKAAGVEVIRSNVGEINAINKMKEVGAIFGGKGNGGMIDPQIHYGRDSLVGIMNVINALRRGEVKMSELAAPHLNYVMKKVKVAVSEQINLPAVYREVLLRYPEAKPNVEDGLRLDWEDKWVHIRSSNTEPVVRIIAEAKTEGEVDGLIEEIQGLLAG